MKVKVIEHLRDISLWWCSCLLNTIVFIIIPLTNKKRYPLINFQLRWTKKTNLSSFPWTRLCCEQQQSFCIKKPPPPHWCCWQQLDYSIFTTAVSGNPHFHASQTYLQPGGGITRWGLSSKISSHADNMRRIKTSFAVRSCTIFMLRAIFIIIIII